MQGKEKDESVTVLASVVALFAKRKGTGEHFVYCRMALSSKALMFSILKVEMQTKASYRNRKTAPSCENPMLSACMKQVMNFGVQCGICSNNIR